MPPLPKYRIMVVDDDNDMRVLISTALAPKYEVVQAHDGLDALQKLDQFEPDFVIVDIVMPLMDGFETCQAIRRNPRFSNLQVMFLSGHGTRENVVKSYECGANLFLSKPIDPDRLVKNVDVYFEQARPPVRQKRLSLRQIEAIDKAGPKFFPRPGAAPKPGGVGSIADMPTSSSAPTSAPMPVPSPAGTGAGCCLS